MASCETWNHIELCRVCGLDLPAGTADVMHHYNSHWRNFNTEQHAQNSCLFEQSPDLHIEQQNINSEDLEVSGHFDQNFHYSYSPQTEPSNLSLDGTRCSPLNLTGKAKIDSPMASPLISPPMPDQQTLVSSHLPVNAYHHQISPDELSEYGISQSYGTFENISMPNCSLPEIPNFEHNVNLNSLPNCELNGIDDNSCKFDRKDKMGNKYHSKYQPDGKSVCDKISDLSCTNQPKIFKSEAISIAQEFMLNSKSSLDINQSIPDAVTYNVSQKPYKCAMCNREFMLKEELTEHFSSHDAAKPYRCNLCGTGLSHVSALRRHTLSHTGLKPHACAVCGRSFYQRCDLQRHMSVHSRKSLQCAVCRRKFTYDYILKHHKCRPPEEARPFKCTICGEGCTTSVAWSYHMWKHTKNPAFVPTCLKVDSLKAPDSHSDSAQKR